MEYYIAFVHFFGLKQDDIFFVIFIGFMIWIFVIFGIQTIHEAIFGTVLGLLIFAFLALLLFSPSTLLFSPETHANIKEYRNGILSFCLYLTIGLSIFLPLNKKIHIETSDSSSFFIALKTLFLGFCFVFFYLSIFFAVVEQWHMFGYVDSVFMHLREFAFWQHIRDHSRFYLLAQDWIDLIIWIGIGFILYKIMLGDVMIILLDKSRIAGEKISEKLKTLMKKKDKPEE